MTRALRAMRGVLMGPTGPGSERVVVRVAGAR